VLIDDNPFVLRAMQPADDRVVLAGTRPDPGELSLLVTTFGRIAAWAHLRSSGRDGSAGADDLIDFARRRKWKSRLVDASIDCAANVARDAAAFNAAWDDGRLAP
jgi:hypothetical protein